MRSCVIALDVQAHGIGWCVCTLGSGEVVENADWCGTDVPVRLLRTLCVLIPLGAMVVSDDPEKARITVQTLAERANQRLPPLRVIDAHTGCTAALRAYRSADHARHLAVATALCHEPKRPHKRTRYG